MRHETQVRILRDVFAAIDAGRPPMTPRSTRNDPSIYTSPERLAAEERVLFRGYPLVAGFGARVRKPGDYFADDLGPVPTLVVRGDDGKLRAFANACRHRAAKVASGAGSEPRGFSCPWHGWCYDLRGRLETVPDAFGFDGVRPGADGLVELPVAERFGLVWVHPDPGGRIDLDAILGGLADDLESYGAERLEIQETRAFTRRMNWKLASDTFWEAYHLRILHADNIGPLFIRTLGHFEPFGPSHRFMGIRSSVVKNRALPESEWTLVPHATILNSLFPNTVFIMQKDHVEVFRIFPVAGKTNECVTEVTVLVDQAGERWKDIMDLVENVIRQDYAIAEGVQRNFEGGCLPHVNYGRFEGALEHFHASMRRALGTTDGTARQRGTVSEESRAVPGTLAT